MEAAGGVAGFGEDYEQVVGRFGMLELLGL